MYYIPLKVKNYGQLKEKQINIGKSDDFAYLFTILDRSERIVYDNKKTLLRYSYSLKYGINKQPLFYISVDKDGNVKEAVCQLCRYTKYCHHLWKITNDISDELEKEKLQSDWTNKRLTYLKEKELEEQNRLKEEEIKTKRNQSLEKIADLLTNLNTFDEFPLMKAVNIAPILTLSSSRREITAYLSLKVGIDKYYVVSNIINFFDLVKTSSQHSYGKNLSFRHSLSNFDPPSQKLLQLLFTSNKSNQSSYKYNYQEISVSLKTVEEIFSIYHGCEIEIKFEDINLKNGIYAIGFKEEKVGFYLNDKYNLKITGIKDEFILNCPNQVFVIKDLQVNPIKFESEKLYSLFKFVRSNPSFNFEYIKDVLSKEILPRYYQNIEIDEKIKSEISLKEYKIETYFDYEDEKIISVSKFFYDNHQVDEKEIENEKMTFLKLEKYKLLLNAIGITDGQITQPEKVFQFLKTDLKDLKDMSDVYVSEKLKKLQSKSFKPLKMNLSYQTGLLQVCMVESEYTDEELAKIIKNIRKKNRYIKLRKDVILEITEEDANKFLNTIDELNLDINSLTKEQKLPIFQSLKLHNKTSDFIAFEKSVQLEQLLSEIANYKKADFIVPPELNNVMRSYQKEAFLWMKTLVKYNLCGVLADDMGLGKTLEMISVILSDESNTPSLIVCPKSLCYNWKSEMKLWAPSIETINIIGFSSERKDLINKIDNNKKQLFITSYDSLRSDWEYYQDKGFRFLILDEAQYIKNHETLKAQSVKKLNSQIRFVLTGTPIENSVTDLWSIFDFLMSGYLNTYQQFRSKYEKTIVENKDSAIIDELILKITPFILRRTKKDVIKDLPEKYEIVQTAKMTEPQRKVYEAELRKTRNILESSDNKIELLACLTRLRQACVDPHMYLEDYHGGSGKLTLLMELIEEYIASGSRILVFSQFTSVFEDVEKMLQEKAISYYILTGKTSASDRVMMATEFNEYEDKKVFLVSLKAGGTGLNLVGADVVIHLDPWWNVAAENQATDRAHRIGQSRMVQVIKLVCEETIEQKVIELQERKKEIVKMIVADDDSNIQKLSKEDINYLLN